MTVYNKENPFLASIKDRFSLSRPGSKKNTQHLVLDLAGSGLTYRAGDCLGIFAQHDPLLVEKTINALRVNGREIVSLKQKEKTASLREALTTHLNITEISPRLFREIALRQTNQEKKDFLNVLLEEENLQKKKEYLGQFELWDLLLAHEEVVFTPQEIADFLMPLLPRFYSISSSQKYVGEEVHLTVAQFEFESNGYMRHGVCSHYLSKLVTFHDPVVPVFVHPSHHFFLPEITDTAMIMIGPGTGVAPFRAFIQDRIFHQSGGKHWLFFGEWNRDFDFFYEEDWKSFGEKTHLILDLAFSRDQKEKVYVQHKMREKGQELFAWLEQGAYLYVCGDAQRMAKDVESTLMSIIAQHSEKGEAGAKEYLKKLRKEKRYLRDVY